MYIAVVAGVWKSHPIHVLPQYEHHTHSYIQFFLWNFNQKIEEKKRIFRRSTGFLNCTCPYKQCYIAGSAKWSSKHLSIILTSIGKLLTCILLTVKTGLQSYNFTRYSRDGGVNQIWILNFKKNVIWSAYIHNLSPCIIALKHLTSHNYSPAQSKDKLIIDN